MTHAVCVVERPKTAKDALYELQRRWIVVNGHDPDEGARLHRDVWYMHPISIRECECYGGDHLRSYWFRFVKVNMRGQGGDLGEEYVRASSRREATFLVYDRVMADPGWDPR